MFSVSMSATDSTYEFDVHMFDGRSVTTRTLTLDDVRRLYPTAMNEQDALAWVAANMELAFESAV